MFEPFQTRLVIRLSIVYRFDDPILREAALSVLTREMVGPLNHQKRRDASIFAIDASNRRRPFPITWLNSLASSASIGARNYHGGIDKAYYKAGLVEVIEIVVLDTVLSPHILYQPKPRAYKFGIFI